MEYQTYLYMICYPNPSLVASQLDYEQFARHYVMGSSRDYSGRLIFAELDPGYRHEFFDIDKAYKELVPHEDGRPKATKFIASYRILEHVAFGAIQRLYLTTPAGYAMYMEPASFEKKPSRNIIRVFAEINPIRMLVLSRYDYIEFGRFITSPHYPKGAPKLFYTQLEFDIEEFLEEFAANPLMQTPIPGLHPSKIRDAILEVKNIPTKVNKGLAMDCPMDRIPWRMIRHGFMFASQDEYKFFPMPELSIIEKNFYKFYKTMD